MHRLQIGQTAIAGVSMLFGQFRSAIRIAWFPLLLLIAIQAVMAVLILPEIEAITAEMEAGGEVASDAVEQQLEQFIATSGWKLSLIMIVSSAVFAMLTSGWIQQVLRGDAVGSSTGFFRFGGRELRILLAGLMFMLLVVVVMAIVAAAGIGFSSVTAIPSFLFVLPAGFIAYVLCLRFIVVFPMISVGEGIRWRAAWALTKGNTWRLFFALFLAWLLNVAIAIAAGIPVSLVTGVLSFLAPGSIVLTMIVPIAAQMILTVFGMMIMLGSLAEAYRQLGGPGIGIPEATLAVFDDA